MRGRSLNGSTALVTGGGTGIGRGIALALARRQVRVALAGRRSAQLEAVAAEIEQLGGLAFAWPADLTRAGERARLQEQIHAALGPIDLLVNNAGVLASGELATLAPAEIEVAVAVNLAAPMLLAQQWLPDLAARRGAVVLVGSMMSLVPLPAASVYSATKGGLRAFGHALRPELRARGVHLLVVYPPGTATAMTATMARNAPWRVGLADPLVVGERIVRALLAGRGELQWGAGERALALAYRAAPRLVAGLLARQHALFARIMNRRTVEAPSPPSPRSPVEGAGE
jgi:short-subunit dehydrogenase